MFDSLYALAKGVHSLQKSAPRSILQNISSSCESETSWMEGSSLYNYINAVRLILTGQMLFFPRCTSLFPVLSVRSFGSFSFSNVIQKDSPVSTEKEGGEYRRKRGKEEEKEILQNHEAHDFLHTTHLFSSLFFLLFMPSLVSLSHATGTKLDSHTPSIAVIAITAISLI
jgi:hypothetical protein